MSEAQKEVREAASEYIHKKHPEWHDRGVGIVQGSHYRKGFEDGAAWQASRAPQPTEDDREYDPDLAAFLSQSLDDEPMWSCVVIAKNLHAAGFRRAPAEPAVTDEMVEAFTVAINRAGYVLDRDATRVGLRATLTTKEGEDR